MSFLISRALGNGRTKRSLLASWTTLSLVLLPLAGVVSLIPQPVQAQEFNKGVAAYKAGKYKEAIQNFQVALSKRPNDSTIYYYIATCYHQLKDLPHAKSYYIEAINFGGLNAVGKNAIRGLSAIDPTTAKSLYRQLAVMHGIAAPDAASQPMSASTRTVSGSSSRVVTSARTSESLGQLIAPQESRIPVTKTDNGAAIVQAQLNGRSIAMLYDTGAENCAFGMNHLKELGINPPTGAHTGYAMGIGDGGQQKTWHMRASLRVGQIERKDFPISVQEHMPGDPLLGQTFFRDFRYEIDNQASAIRLVRTDTAAVAATARSSSIYSGASSSSSKDVPFRKEGNEIIVDVMVNGRPIPMIFDTGADNITFAPQHLQSVGVKVPEDAEDAISEGIAGQTKVKKFNVSRIQLGPIIKQDVPISALEGHTSLPHPLLGQTFFGNWKFAIDNANHLIKFHSASGD
jgi:Predicted aspartyl protease